MNVDWAEPALEDLEAIQAYIAKGSNLYARQFIGRIFEVVKKLEIFPEIGRKIPEAEESPDVRALIFQGYRIIYLIQTESIYIITDQNSALLLPLLLERVGVRRFKKTNFEMQTVYIITVIHGSRDLVQVTF